MHGVSLESDSSNTKDILVLTDHFNKFALAIPTLNQKAKTVAKCVWNDFMVHYGIPERLHSDQGSDFESKLVRGLCEITGIKKSRTTPYHPRGNPVERFNRTLLNMLGAHDTKQKAKWKDHVKPQLHTEQGDRVHAIQTTFWVITSPACRFGIWVTLKGTFN